MDRLPLPLSPPSFRPNVNSFSYALSRATMGSLSMAAYISSGFLKGPCLMILAEMVGKSPGYFWKSPAKQLFTSIVAYEARGLTVKMAAVAPAVASQPPLLRKERREGAGLLLLLLLLPLRLLRFLFLLLSHLFLFGSLTSLFLCVCVFPWVPGAADH